MEELQEQKEINHDLQTIISESMSMDINEDELMEELVNLENEENNICIENVNNNSPSDNSELLANIMHKYKKWEEGDDPQAFPYKPIES